MKKLQFIDIGKPFRIIGKICKDIEREFRFKGINVNFIGMLIDYIGIAFIFKWNLHVDGDSLLLSIKDAVYVYFDTVAQQKGFTGYLDCLASANSNDENKVRYSLIFSSWIDENLAIFNQICEDYKMKRLTIYPLIM